MFLIFLFRWSTKQKLIVYHPRKVVLWIPVVGMAIVGFALYAPESIGYQLMLSYTERTNIFLTTGITVFAAIEGYSTFLQVELAHRRNLIRDAANELEKAYGPLFTLLNKSYLQSKDKNSLWLEPYEKEKIDGIMATYPFMFPSKIFELWQREIQNLNPIVSTSDLEPTGYEFPLKFRDMINEEYGRRVKKYHELLKK